jgi:hypothetical protein
MMDEEKREIPFMLKLTEASQVLRITMGELRVLIRSKELELLNDLCGPRIQTQSIIEFLGRNEFKKRWPRGLGEVKFEERDELVKRKVKGRA